MSELSMDCWSVTNWEGASVEQPSSPAAQKFLQIRLVPALGTLAVVHDGVGSLINRLSATQLSAACRSVPDTVAIT